MFPSILSRLLLFLPVVILVNDLFKKISKKKKKIFISDKTFQFSILNDETREKKESVIL